MDKEPQNFDEAVDMLIAQKFPTDDHFGCGMSLRNNWGLWSNSTPIAKWFTDHELYHGDDRSGILTDAVKAKLKGEPFDVLAKIKWYQEWWFNQYGEEFSLANVKREFLEHNSDD